MPSSTPMRKRRFPLHIHISILFTCLLLLTGTLLGIFNYRHTTRIILSSSEKLFGKIQEDVQQDLQNTYQPIRHLLSLLAIDKCNSATTLAERLALLRPFTQALNDNPDLASLYLG